MDFGYISVMIKCLFTPPSPSPLQIILSELFVTHFACFKHKYFILEICIYMQFIFVVFFEWLSI